MHFKLAQLRYMYVCATSKYHTILYIGNNYIVGMFITYIDGGL